jgi:hypothetical protein
VHGGHARAHRPAADDEPSAPADERRVSHLHAGDVRDRVERARRAADERADPELARPRFGAGRRLRRGAPGERGGRTGGEQDAAEPKRRAYSLHNPP